MGPTQQATEIVANRMIIIRVCYYIFSYYQKIFITKVNHVYCENKQFYYINQLMDYFDLDQSLKDLRKMEKQIVELRWSLQRLKKNQVKQMQEKLNQLQEKYNMILKLKVEEFHKKNQNPSQYSQSVLRDQFEFFIENQHKKYPKSQLQKKYETLALSEAEEKQVVQQLENEATESLHQIDGGQKYFKILSEKPGIAKLLKFYREYLQDLHQNGKLTKKSQNKCEIEAIAMKAIKFQSKQSTIILNYFLKIGEQLITEFLKKIRLIKNKKTKRRQYQGDFLLTVFIIMYTSINRCEKLKNEGYKSTFLYWIYDDLSSILRLSIEKNMITEILNEASMKIYRGVKKPNTLEKDQQRCSTEFLNFSISREAAIQFFQSDDGKCEVILQTTMTSTEPFFWLPINNFLEKMLKDEGVMFGLEFTPETRVAICEGSILTLPLFNYKVWSVSQENVTIQNQSQQKFIEEEEEDDSVQIQKIEAIQIQKNPIFHKYGQPRIYWIDKNVNIKNGYFVTLKKLGFFQDSFFIGMREFDDDEVKFSGDFLKLIAFQKNEIAQFSPKKHLLHKTSYSMMKIVDQISEINIKIQRNSEEIEIFYEIDKKVISQFTVFHLLKQKQDQNFAFYVGILKKDEHIEWIDQKYLKNQGWGDFL